MSVEGPEARILAEQLVREVVGRRVVECAVHDVAGLQRCGFVNQNLADFDRMIGATITAVASRGNTIRLALGNAANLLIAPEYGGRVLLHECRGGVPAKTHLEACLDDGRVLSVRLTGMGVLRCDLDERIDGAYVYQRDFSETPDPVIGALPLETFERLVAARGQALKAVLVGKDAIVVGISNSAFQDILYRAGLHPKRKASELTGAERGHLHSALRALVRERLGAGGKSDFVDLYGTPGRYQPMMGPNRKETICEACGHAIDSLALGGGRVYYCPGCQH